MRAAVCREFGAPLRLEEVELAPPGPGEVRVRVDACGICHSDVAYADGAWGGALPAVYGHEAAGVVLETGPDVDGVEPGRAVVVSLVRSCGRCELCARGLPALCDASFLLDAHSPLGGGEIAQGMRVGAFAEEVVVHESQAVPVPDGVPLDRACLLACAVATGWGAVTRDARVEPGASVAVIGTGGVGLNCVQAAAYAGADTIVAVDLSPAKLEAALAFGATDVGDVSGAADYVFVAAASGAAFEQGLRMLRRGGTLVAVGMPPSGVVAAFDPADLAHNGQRIVGSKMGSTRPAEDIPALAELYRAGRLKLDELISGRYPLDAVNDAIASARNGAALRNVLVSAPN
jgi:S-(hydroxymethyl)glutathione dehydrogenase/alcohol dehydrogenase